MPSQPSTYLVPGPSPRARRGLAVAALVLLLAGDSYAAPVGDAFSGSRMVAGWLPYWSAERSVAVFHAHHDLFSEVSPFSYHARSATDIREIRREYSPRMLRSLRRPGVAVLPSVTESLGPSAMARLLRDPGARRAHVSALVRLVTASGFDGIDLDYERMNFGGTRRIKDRVRAGFVTLVAELAGELHKRGKLLSVTVGPRRSATDRNWSVHDYAGLGRHADRIRVMTYDHHTRGGRPGPIAPLPWTEQVLAFAASQVPAAKVQAGVPTYGYDWPVRVSGRCPRGAGRPRARSLTTRTALDLARAKGVAPTWSAAHAERTFSYPDPRTYRGLRAGRPTSCRVKRVVWYADADSTRLKAELVARRGLGGLALWTVGGEDAAQWAHLRATANARQSGR